MDSRIALRVESGKRRIPAVANMYIGVEACWDGGICWRACERSGERYEGTSSGFIVDIP